MTPLSTENLDLTFTDNIAHITVSGAMETDTLEAGLAWMDEVVEANDNFSIRVDMAKDDFADLGEIRSEFKQVGRILRHASLEENLGADKCAVLTDSLFLRNSAKIEGAVIPGLDVNTFALEATDAAEKWLLDQPLVEPETTSEDIAASGKASGKKEDANKEQAEKRHGAVGPAPTALNLVSPAEMKQAAPDAPDAPDAKETAEEKADNPWGDFRAI